MAHKKLTLPVGMPLGALNLPQAALYVGVCPTTLITMVKQGVMPPPRVFGARKIWIVRDLDTALSRLPTAASTSWEAA